MNDILHCPSGQRGAILGSSQRHFIVKTDRGDVQNWTKETTRILRRDYMTSRIMIKLTGGPSKLYSNIERLFNTIDEAAEYVSELARIDGIKEVDKTGQVATLGNGWTLYSNYSIKEIIKKVPPNKVLWDWYPFDLQKKMNKREFRSASPLTVAPPSTKKSGKMIKLQDLTKDGRAARVILRSLVRQKKITKNGRWEWEEGSPDLEVVKKALEKGK